MHPDCCEPGIYRAPKSPHQLNEYYWFCLEHVRAYNAQWDFFKGMSTAQIEAELRADQTWQRPSWPLGAQGKIHDPMGLLGKQEAPKRPQKPLTAEEQALATLGFSGETATAETPYGQSRVGNISFAEIKARYKSLVKQLHPDANGGDRAAEDRLKDVNRAYSTLKASYRHVV